VHLLRHLLRGQSAFGPHEEDGPQRLVVAHDGREIADAHVDVHPSWRQKVEPSLPAQVLEVENAQQLHVGLDLGSFHIPLAGHEQRPRRVLEARDAFGAILRFVSGRAVLVLRDDARQVREVGNSSFRRRDWTCTRRVSP
jgi:hypothetical protein